VQKNLPMFQGENLAKNQVLLKRVAKIAEEKKCTTSQLALAWVKQKGGADTVPIPGTTKTANFESNVAALGLELTEEDMKALEDAVPANEVAGDRYVGGLAKISWQNVRTPPLSSWKSPA
jgi:aryl-alcohol dehydrogenase-like predicted oxidoreductase